jgi:rhodanese-related sulfurtransferase
MKRYTIVLVILSLFIAAGTLPARSSKDPVITPSEVHALLGKDTTHIYLDVRTPAEFDGPSGHVPGSFLIPVQELEARMGELNRYKGKTIIAICRSGNRSGFATAMLREQGFKALNMVGGMVRWNAEGLPAQHTETK